MVALAVNCDPAPLVSPVAGAVVELMDRSTCEALTVIGS